MIQLASKNIEKLTQATQDVLADLQDEVEAGTSFQIKKDTAKQLWNNKKGSNDNRTAFEEIEAELKALCVSVEVCNYCEQNEANDIEHITPKSYFPSKAFKWNNYLLACKQCNTGYKLDKCYVLDDKYNICELNRGDEPPFQETAFINPRTEDPNDFLILNLRTYKFELLPDLSKKDRNKAEKTLEILRLNERAKLDEARESAYDHYYDSLDRLCAIIQAPNIKELKNKLRPNNHLIDDSLPLATIKEQITLSYKRHLQIHQHPSVWYAIKTIERHINQKWKVIFDILPQALNW